MRAERMVAIVLLLQTHPQLTVPELARRLEVSERTVRRDLDALLNAGVPIYSQRGRGGGWALLNGHGINLTGLTDEEAGALLLVAGPASRYPAPGPAVWFYGTDKWGEGKFFRTEITAYRSGRVIVRLGAINPGSID